MNRTDRLVAMVMHLQGRRVVRGEELSERFEISLRTVYRDIAALAEAGVPIAAEAGVGYTLLRNYHLPPVMLTADEAGALFLGAQFARQFGDASIEGPAAAALDKLRAVMPKDRQEHVEQLAQRTIIFGQPAAARDGTPAGCWLLEVQRAVAGRRVLRVRYRGRWQADLTDRAVEPLGVAFYRGAWYLVGWCRLRRDYRHFRVDRIVRAEMTPETIPARPDFSLAQHLKAQAERTGALLARIWLSERAVERARHESFATLAEEKRRDGGAEFSVCTFSLEWLARWLLSFGPEGEALDPPDLRQQVRDLAEETARRHCETADIRLSAG